MLHVGDILHAQERPDRKETLDRICICIVALAVTQNFLLSILDNYSAIDSSAVVLVQSAVTAGAVLLILWRRAAIPIGILAASGLIVCCFIICISEHDGPQYHFLYDIFVIPIFALLGSTMAAFPLPLLTTLIKVATAVGVAEIFVPNLYEMIVNPLRYYINTRAWILEGNIIDSDMGFYIGANRSGGSIFSVLGIDHRIGSIFLEPLSLGLFANVGTIFLCLQHPFKHRTAFVLLTLLLPLLADSRTGVMLGLSILCSSHVLRDRPAWLCATVPPLVTMMFLLAQQLAPEDGELVYRLSLTFETLGRADWATLFFGGLDQSFANDSAILSMIGHVGMVGLAAIFYLYAAISLAPGVDRRVSVYVMLYVTVTAFFGGALFSIKTASLLGFLIGASRAGTTEPVPETERVHDMQFAES